MRAAVILLMAILAGGAGFETLAEPEETTQALVAKHLVDIGAGRHRNLICLGQGTPTVVFEQGAGSEILHWRKVARAVARFTRACLYDRAGYGFSDPADRPMTAMNVTDDLRALLSASGVDRPIVLVAHSLGGLFATVYADRFPSEVAGMVLVDPAFGAQFDFERSSADQTAFAGLVVGNLELTLGCARLARERKLTQDDRHDCFVPGPRGTPEEAAYRDRFTRPFRAEAEFLEMESALPIGDATPENSLEERAVARDFGDMPLIVLTAGNPQKFPLISDSANTANAENWKRGHDALAKRSSRGKSLVVADAGHFIQIDQPMAVVDAVRDVVDAARRRGANSRP